MFFIGHPFSTWSYFLRLSFYKILFKMDPKFVFGSNLDTLSNCLVDVNHQFSELQVLFYMWIIPSSINFLPHFECKGTNFLWCQSGMGEIDILGLSALLN